MGSPAWPRASTSCSLEAGELLLDEPAHFGSGKALPEQRQTAGWAPFALKGFAVGAASSAAGANREFQRCHQPQGWVSMASALWCCTQLPESSGLFVPRVSQLACGAVLLDSPLDAEQRLSRPLAADGPGDRLTSFVLTLLWAPAPLCF